MPPASSSCPSKVQNEPNHAVPPTLALVGHLPQRDVAVRSVRPPEPAVSTVEAPSVRDTSELPQSFQLTLLPEVVLQRTFPVSLLGLLLAVGSVITSLMCPKPVPLPLLLMLLFEFILLSGRTACSNLPFLDKCFATALASCRRRSSSWVCRASAS